MARNVYRNLGMEQLEDRQVLAGNVAAVLSGDTLTLTGDNLNNQLYITRIDAQTIHIESGQSATTINGNAAPIDINFAEGGKLKINMKGGGDEITLGDPNSQFNLKTLSIDMGSGQDLLTVWNCNTSDANVATNISMGSDGSTGFNGLEMFNGHIAGDLNLKGNGFQSSLELFGVTVDKNVKFQLGGGPDGAQIINSHIGGNLTLNMGAGDNTGIVTNTTAGGKFQYNGGNGVDTLNVTSLFAASARMNLAGGNDVLTVSGLSKAVGPVKADDVQIDAGSGDDQVTLGFVNSLNARVRLGGGVNTFNGGVFDIDHMRIDCGSNKDSVSVGFSTFLDLYGGLLGGGDDLHLDHVTVVNKVTLNGGAGTDVLTQSMNTLPADPTKVVITSF